MTYAIVPAVTAGGSVHYVRRPITVPGTRRTVMLTECGMHVSGHRRDIPPSGLTCGRCVRSLP